MVKEDIEAKRRAILGANWWIVAVGVIVGVALAYFCIEPIDGFLFGLGLPSIIYRFLTVTINFGFIVWAPILIAKGEYNSRTSAIKGLSDEAVNVAYEQYIRTVAIQTIMKMLAGAVAIAALVWFVSDLTHGGVRALILGLTLGLVDVGGNM